MGWRTNDEVTKRFKLNTASISGGSKRIDGRTKKESLNILDVRVSLRHFATLLNYLDKQLAYWSIPCHDYEFNFRVSRAVELYSRCVTDLSVIALRERWGARQFFWQFVCLFVYPELDQKGFFQDSPKTRVQNFTTNISLMQQWIVSKLKKNNKKLVYF